MVGMSVLLKIMETSRSLPLGIILLFISQWKFWCYSLVFFKLSFNADFGSGVKPTETVFGNPVCWEVQNMLKENSKTSKTVCGLIYLKGVLYFLGTYKDWDNPIITW